MEEKECGPEGDFLQAPHMNLQKHCALFDNSRKPAILPLWLPSCLLSLCLLLPLFYIATNPSIVFPRFPSDPNSFTGLQNFHEIWSPASSHLRSIQPVIGLNECWRISNKIFSFSAETFSQSQSVAENQEDPHATQPYAQIPNRHVTDTKLVDSKELQRNPYWQKNTRNIKSAWLT